MVAITICTDFGAQKNKISHYFQILKAQPFWPLSQFILHFPSFDPSRSSGFNVARFLLLSPRSWFPSVLCSLRLLLMVWSLPRSAELLSFLTSSELRPTKTRILCERVATWKLSRAQTRRKDKDIPLRNGPRCLKAGFQPEPPWPSRPLPCPGPLLKAAAVTEAGRSFVATPWDT